jgi:hypothetical protein
MRCDVYTITKTDKIMAKVTARMRPMNQVETNNLCSKGPFPRGSVEINPVRHHAQVSLFRHVSSPAIRSRQYLS